MDINALITKKEIHFRNVVWRMGQPQPVALDTCYTPWGFVIPMADNYAILETFKRSRLDTMFTNNDGWRGAILTPENEFYCLRFYEDCVVYSHIGEEISVYAISEESSSNSVAAAINYMNSSLTPGEFRIPRTARQIIHTIQDNFPTVGDYLVMKRTDILEELKRRHPKTKPLPFHNDFKGNK